MWTRFKHWLIRKLGGYVEHDCKRALWSTFETPLVQAVSAACSKVLNDPSFAQYEGSNLGRNVLRDEAAEWTKLYLKDMGASYKDSDVHLACELYYHLTIRSKPTPGKQHE
jgi:hypothetical protein